MSFVLSMESGKGFRKGKNYVEAFFLDLWREKNDRCFETRPLPWNLCCKRLNSMLHSGRPVLQSSKNFL